MARFTRIQVATAMAETGLVPVFYHKDVEVCKSVIKACYNGGIRVFEFTNRGDYANEVFSQITKWVAVELPELIMGAGTVVDAPTAAIYIQAGANFIVSPLLNPEIAKVCNRRKIAWSPGCGTLSEISLAEELGAEIIKIFPGTTVGGPEFVKSVKGPCPWTSIMPTGGVEPTEDNLRKWFKAGVTCVGMGSNLFPAGMINAKNWDYITEACSSALTLIKTLRG